MNVSNACLQSLYRTVLVEGDHISERPTDIDAVPRHFHLHANATSAPESTSTESPTQSPSRV